MAALPWTPATLGGVAPVEGKTIRELPGVQPRKIARRLSTLQRRVAQICGSVNFAKRRVGTIALSALGSGCLGLCGKAAQDLKRCLGAGLRHEEVVVMEPSHCIAGDALACEPIGNACQKANGIQR